MQKLNIIKFSEIKTEDNSPKVALCKCGIKLQDSSFEICDWCFDIQMSEEFLAKEEYRQFGKNRLFLVR